jgi:hypothetical protein
MKEFKLGKVAGLNLSAIPLAIVGSLLLFVILSVVATTILQLPVGTALIGSFVAVILHWVSDIAHHLGHAQAARKTGYPMIGVRLGTWAVLGTSLYPDDEPELPADIHIRRALGGPAGSLLVSLIAAIIALLLYNLGEALWWVAVFLFLDNLMVFTIGTFLPLGFTDGSTLLYWRGKR